MVETETNRPDDLALTPSDVRGWDFNDLKMLSIKTALESQLQDVEKFALAVDGIECLIWYDLMKMEEMEFRRRGEGKASKPTYLEDLGAKMKELGETYGTRDDRRLFKLKELAQFKFRLLLCYIRERMPVHVEGKI